MDLDDVPDTAELLLPRKVLEAASNNGLESYLLSQPLVVGVSGGPDSLALLHILCSLRGPRASQTLHVAHLDHALRGAASEEDARFVAELAEKWVLPYTIRRFDVEQYAKIQHQSIEEAARNARYSFLAALAQEQSAAVAVAHNADDQVETVLMHILRGSGISGLRGMKMLATVPVQSFLGIGDQGSGIRDQGSEVALEHPDPRSPDIPLFRPLLGVWRREIEEYCAKVGLQPRLDETNAERQYKRNRIRSELIPLLEREYDPAVKVHLHNLAELAAGEDELIESIVEQEAQRLANMEVQGVVRFKQVDIAGMPEALRLRLVRWALKQVGGTLEGFTRQHIEEAAKIVSGRADSPRVSDLPHGLTVERLDGWSVISLRRASEFLLEADTSEWPVVDLKSEQLLVAGNAVRLDAGWRLDSIVMNPVSEKRTPGDTLALFDMDELERLGLTLMVRARRPGDYLKPIGMNGRKSLQDLFIDAKIPRRVRDHISLVVCSKEGGEVLWVPGPGGRRSAHAPVGPQTRRILRFEFTRTR